MPPTTLCVTPNMALDRTLLVPGFRVGAVQRPAELLNAAGGKGMNVARALHRLGGSAHCTGLLGGYNGQFVAALAAAEGLPGDWTWFDGETRICTSIVDPQSGKTTALYESGPPISAADWERFSADVLRAAGTHDNVCISGSLPRGVPPHALAELIAALHNSASAVWVDTSGPALEAALVACPSAIKVNAEEAGALLGQPLDSVAAACAAAIAMQRRGIALVALTLGAQGAVLCDASGCCHAAPPPGPIVSPVGSGDAFLAGLVLARGQGLLPDEALRHAVAAGTANARYAGGGRFTLADVQAVLAEMPGGVWC